MILKSENLERKMSKAEREAWCELRGITQVNFRESQRSELLDVVGKLIKLEKHGLLNVVGTALFAFAP